MEDKPTPVGLRQGYLLQHDLAYPDYYRVADLSDITLMINS